MPGHSFFLLFHEISCALLTGYCLLLSRLAGKIPAASRGSATAAKARIAEGQLRGNLVVSKPADHVQQHLKSKVGSNGPSHDHRALIEQGIRLYQLLPIIMCTSNMVAIALAGMGRFNNALEAESLALVFF